MYIYTRRSSDLTSVDVAEDCRAGYALEFEGLLVGKVNANFMIMKSLLDKELDKTTDMQYILGKGKWLQPWELNFLIVIQLCCPLKIPIFFVVELWSTY